MAILEFVVSLAGATMLLLFAVRMVRTGVERIFGPAFQAFLSEERSLVGAGAGGVCLAILLQSSAAVTLLASGFFAGGFMPFGVGLAVVLGGDLGSALVIQVLSFRLDWLVPVLLAVGGWMFVKVEQKQWRQAGRILMGIAFILISLRFLREAMDPIRDSAFLPAIAAYLEADFLTAFIVGAALSFVMHSSVAAILMCVTLLQVGAIPFAAALSLTLGANLGSALIPLWLSRGLPARARRLPVINLALRGTWAVVILLVVNLILEPAALQTDSPVQSLIVAHILFNASLLLVCLPFCKMLAAPMARLLPEPAAPADPATEREPSALDENASASPALAIASIKRELLRMSGIVARMHTQFEALYARADRALIKRLHDTDLEVNEALSGIRNYVANLPSEAYSKADMKTVRGLLDYAIRLETAGDIISTRMAQIARSKQEAGARFSDEGWGELCRINRAIAENFKLAANVLVSDDLESARLLAGEKTELKNAEFKSRKQHVKRLQSGRAESFGSSDAHLETLRALRDLNSCISAVATPTLYREGQLLETRLIDTLSKA